MQKRTCCIEALSKFVPPVSSLYLKVLELAGRGLEPGVEVFNRYGGSRMILHPDLCYELVEYVLFSFCNNFDIIRFQIFDKTCQLQFTCDPLHSVPVTNSLNLALCNDHCSFHAMSPSFDFVSCRTFMSYPDLLDLWGDSVLQSADRI